MSRLIILFSILLAVTLFPGKAEASPDNCTYPSVALDQNLVGPINAISQSAIIGLMKDCALTAFNAAIESVKSMGSCVAHPIKCGEAAIEGIGNAYNFISNLGTELSKMWKTLSGMTGEQMAQVLCSVIGSLAPDVLIAILTAGAASGKLGITIARIILKLKQISDILKLTVAIPIKLLGEFSEEMLKRMIKLLKSDDKAELENYIQGLGCAI